MGILQWRAASQLDTDRTSRVEGLVSLLDAAASEYGALQGALSLWDVTNDSNFVPSLGQGPPDQQLLKLQSVPQTHDDYAANSLTDPSFSSPPDRQPIGLQTVFQPHGDDATNSLTAPLSAPPPDQQLMGLQTVFQPHGDDATNSLTAPLFTFPPAQQLMGLQAVFQTQDDGAANSLTAPSFAGHVPLDGAEALNPEAWLDGIPPIISGAVDLQNTQLAPSVAAEPDDGGASTSVLGVGLLPHSEGVTDVPPNVLNHPFVRLPILGDGVVIRRIKVENLFNPHRMKVPLYLVLLKLKKLFSQAILNQEDVNALVTATEHLISTAWRQALKGPRKNRPVCAAEAFGYYFLTFDALVCVFQLLGNNMELHLWWGKFIAAFNHDPSSFMRPIGSRAGGVHRRLVQRICAVLEVYKAAKRPAPKEVIELKNMLFGSPSAPGDFKDRKWDPWRKDAKGI